MQIRIKRLIEKVPGGMMVVPLLTGAIINTFFPETPKFFGSFTGALFNPMPTLAAFFVCMGASIDIQACPQERRFAVSDQDRNRRHLRSHLRPLSGGGAHQRRHVRGAFHSGDRGGDWSPGRF